MKEELKKGDLVGVIRNEKGILRPYKGEILFKPESRGFDIDINGSYCFAWYEGKVPLSVRGLLHFVYQLTQP